MKLFSSCRWLQCLSLLFFLGISSFPLTNAANKNDDATVMDSLKNTYEELPDAGELLLVLASLDLL
jgi:hypothetical protein